MRKNAKGFTLIELLIVVAIIGIIAAIAIPNLLNAIDRGKQKRTMADLRSVGTSVETYSIDNNEYPTAATPAALALVIEPTYIRNMPVDDGWNNPIFVDSDPTTYTICSGGKDGDDCLGEGAGATNLFTDGITFVDGQFTQWPDGVQR
jgi:type II secretion system protein G